MVNWKAIVLAIIKLKKVLTPLFVINLIAIFTKILKEMKMMKKENALMVF